MSFFITDSGIKLLILNMSSHVNLKCSSIKFITSRSLAPARASFNKLESFDSNRIFLFKTNSFRLSRLFKAGISRSLPTIYPNLSKIIQNNSGDAYSAAILPVLLVAVCPFSIKILQISKLSILTAISINSIDKSHPTSIPRLNIST